MTALTALPQPFASRLPIAPAAPYNLPMAHCFWLQYTDQRETRATSYQANTNVDMFSMWER